MERIDTKDDFVEELVKKSDIYQIRTRDNSVSQTDNLVLALGEFP